MSDLKSGHLPAMQYLRPEPCRSRSALKVIRLPSFIYLAWKKNVEKKIVSLIQRGLTALSAQCFNCGLISGVRLERC
jgi:hypothetical protein